MLDGTSAGATANATRVLVIEDDEDDFALVQALLSDVATRTFEIFWASSFDEGLRAARSASYDVCLVDFRLGPADGTDLVRALRADGSESPIVLLTSHDDRTVDVTAMAAGATDYLPKALLTPALLERVIRYAIERTRVAEETRANEERLRLVMRATRDVVVEWSPHTQRVAHSESLQTVLGHGPGAETTQPSWWVDLIHPADRARVLAEVTQGAASDRDTWFAEFRVRRGDGTYADVFGRCWFDRDEERVLRRIVAGLADVTDKRRIERELVRSDAQFSSVMQTAAEGVWTIDRHHRTRYVNPAMADMLGTTTQELAARSLYDFVAETEREHMRRRLAERLAGLSDRYEVKLRGAHGRDVWALVSATPVFDGEGRPDGALKMVTDITARKRAELERDRLLKNEQAARRVAESLSSVAAMLLEHHDVHAVMQRVAEAARDVTSATVCACFVRGRGATFLLDAAASTAEVPASFARAAPTLLAEAFDRGIPLRIDDVSTVGPGLGFERSVAPGTRSFLAVPVRSAAAGVVAGICLEHAEAHRFTDDHVRVVDAMAVLLGDAFHKAAMYQEALATHASLESKQREIARMAARYRSLAAATTQVIFTRDDAGLGTGEHEAWTSFTGQPPSAFCDWGWLSAVHADDRERVRAAWQEGLVRRRAFDTNFRLQRREGGFAEVSFRAVPVVEDDGTVQELVASLTDCTAANAMERRLRLSDRMASIGTLAAGVAHEINNPLAAIAVNLAYMHEQLRAADVANGDLVAALGDASQATDRVRVIVRDLKSFSREADTELRPLDVREALQAAANMTRHEIRHRASLVMDAAPIPPVLGMEARLGQVFVNLLVNAAQAIPEGRAAQNEIRCRTYTDGAGRAVVEVSDTGCGIPLERQSRVFDAFFTTKPVGQGTGLGLSIAHHIVSEMGGEITVESAVGEGTTFRIVLPACASATPPVEDAAPPDLAPTRRARVLVVDDEPAIGVAISRVLQPAHEVVWTSGASEALRLLTSDRSFDVVLCDLMMPTMTGMELFGEVRVRAPEVAERFVFMTGGAFTPGAQDFLAQVTSPHIEKPFAPTQLRDLVAARLLA